MRAGATKAAQVARVNYPNIGASHAQTEATDAAVISFTITSDDPDFDVQRDDRVIVVDRKTKDIIWQYGVTGVKVIQRQPF